MDAPPLRSLRPLRSDDAPQVTRWLRDYLARHRTWWQRAYGRAPEAPLERLVARDWRELLAAATATTTVAAEEGGGDGGEDPAGHWVRVAAGTAQGTEGAPLGVAWAELRPDRYMGYPVGTLQWIYVDRGARGRGVADALLDAAVAWMESSGAHGKQVFVTADNAAAVALYRRHGYRVVDHRMLAP